MAVEIERKYLVTSEAWRGQGNAVRLVQGYLHNSGGYSVRIRVAGTEAWLTVKGGARGATRLEFEYSIPQGDAQAMLEFCPDPVIDKTRHHVPMGDLVWEVDEFHGDNAGLVVAELELEREDQDFEAPAWVGEEVTGDPKYLNVNLVRNPFRRWGGDHPDRDG